MKLSVSLDCPQCGGPVELDETDRLFGCHYCRSRLYITAPEEFSYWIPPEEHLPDELIFIPYWRFKGFSLTIRRGQTNVRRIDTSYLGVSLKGFPPSLGIRTQTLSIRYITSGLPHFFVAPAPFKDILPYIEQRLADADTMTIQGSTTKAFNIISHSYIGEMKSLVYQPYYLKNDVIYDAITNTPLPENAILENVNINKSFEWGLKFIPAQCPDCGWDLDGEKDSLVLFCRNCHSAWSACSGMLSKLEYQIADVDNASCSIYLPFWKFRAEISPIVLDNYVDLIRFANLPRVPQKHWESRLFYFWVPAFKIQPEKFLNITKVTTLSQMDSHVSYKLPKEKIFTTTLPSEEAWETVTALLFEISKPRKKMIDHSKDLKVSLIKKDYVLVPFKETPYLFTQPQTGIGISKGLLKYGRYI